MCSAYQFNEGNDNTQPWLTPFPVWNKCVVPCPGLTVASWPAYRFLTRKVRWSGIPISWRILHRLLWPHSQRLWCSQLGRGRCFSGTLFSSDARDAGNLVSGSSTFSEYNLNIWKFTIHFLLSCLENFEHYVANMWDECNSVVVWAFFAVAFLWDWNEKWPFPVLWPLVSFPNLLAHWVQHFHSIIV